MAYLIESLANFVIRASYEDLSESARNHLKIRTLDALGCAIGALDGIPRLAIRQHLKNFDGSTHCT
ncbi:MAG: MmgE/PrpD family protein [Calditrichota bacterium]